MIVPGHRADVGAPVAADLGLVAHAADRHAHELAPERARDRLAERGLADAGRPDEAEDLARDLVAELRDREVLDDPLLDLVEVEVVVVEHLARVVEVEVVLGERAPRQRRGSTRGRCGSRRTRPPPRQPLEPRELAVGRLPHVLGQRQRLEPLAQLVDLGLLGVALAELLPGSPSAAGAGSTRAGPSPSRTAPATGSSSRARTPRARAEDRRDLAQPLLDVDRLEELLALLGRDRPQRRGDEVRERARVVDVRRRELQLLGQVRREPDDAREQALHVARQRLDLGRVDELVRHRLEAGRRGTGRRRSRFDEPDRAAGRRRGSAASRRAP